jgi:hypothetical protein
MCLQAGDCSTTKIILKKCLLVVHDFFHASDCSLAFITSYVNLEFNNKVNIFFSLRKNLNIFEVYWSLIDPPFGTRMITRKIGDEILSLFWTVAMKKFHSEDRAHAAVDLFNEVISLTFYKIANLMNRTCFQDCARRARKFW